MSLREFVVDEDMARHVQTYIDTVKHYADGAEILVEQRLDFGELIGQRDQFGTSDAVVLRPPELQVHDLKFGMGVRVDAERNEQLMLYALGALYQFGPLAEFERVTMVIHQPRLGHVSEWTCSVKELLEFAERAQQAAARASECMRRTVTIADLKVGEDQCRWCRAKATCPAIAAKVSEEFEAVPAPDAATDERLAQAMANVELVEGWCKAIRAETERRLLAGQPVPGFKLVEGRRGARKWQDEKAVEAQLKAMRLRIEEMYDLSLISPTAAERLVKSEVIGPRQWTKLESLITQSDGKPSVAPATDKRPAIAVAAVASEFSTVN